MTAVFTSRLRGFALATILAAGIALPSSALAAVATIACPANAPLAEQTFVSEITFAIGQTPLGAYTVDVTYDETVVVIDAIDGGTTSEFAGAPFANPATFASGTTRVSGF